MNANAIRRDEQIELIMKCRQSGLSDYQWCEIQGIKPSTFYNWVSKLRRVGYTIPDSESRNTGAAITQEVVKLDLMEREIPCPPLVEQNNSSISIQSMPSIAAEIQIGVITLRIFNGADSLVIQNTLNYIGGVSHAW